MAERKAKTTKNDKTVKVVKPARAVKKGPKKKPVDLSNNKVQKFNDKPIRTVWDSAKNKRWFCVMDVIASLSTTKDPKDYLKKMRLRDTELREKWPRIVRLFPYQTAGGIQKLNFADSAGITRIIKTMSDSKTEPFKKWIDSL